MRRPVIGLTVVLAIASCGAAPEAATTLVTTTTTSTTATTLVTTTTTSTTATTAPVQPTSALPVFPAERTSLEHGGDTWAVVLAGSENFDDPVLTEAAHEAEQAGYTTGATDCDFGASEALGLPASGVYTISVYLENEAYAEAALRAFEARGVSGVVALVQTFCMD
jgi:hypothetical protein